jgi:HAD superfamily hydrolase (TIGR01549 family)
MRATASTVWPPCFASADDASLRVSPLRAVLFDAGNTLLFLDYPRLARSIGGTVGVPLTGATLAAGAQVAALAMERGAATDRERAARFLEALFLEAGVPGDRMEEVRAALTRLHGERHLWSAVAADAVDALARLRRAGLRLGVVSNSDGRVEEALEAAGLRDFFDVVVDSTHAGVEKPDPTIFRAALDALGVAPAEALYVGDLYEVDVIGANAAGIPAVLLTAGPAPAEECATAASLGALVDDLLKERLG